MMIIIFFFCSMLIVVNHPLPMSIFLVSNTIFMSLFMNYYTNMLWQSLIMFLILVGGILILFLYMASISPNTKFLKNFKVYFFIMLILLAINQKFQMMSLSPSTMILPNMFLFSYSIIIFLTIYLLYALIIISFINKTYMGPLRSYYE